MRLGLFITSRRIELKHLCGITLMGLSFIMAPAQARRLPEPGGIVHVTLAPETEQAFVEAHLSIPLLEPTKNDTGIATALDSTSSWTSSLIDSIRGTNNHQTWLISPKIGQAAIVSTALTSCLSMGNTSITRWPAKIIHNFGITHKTELVQGEIKLTFSKPMGPLPELLAGCSIGLKSTSSKGAFMQINSRTLVQNPKSLVPAPLLTTVHLDAATRSPHISQSRSKAASVKTLVDPIPDVVLLTQAPKVMKDDPLRLQSSEGMNQFLEHLGIPLLLSISNESYGRHTETILPSGIVPSLPLSPRRTFEKTQLNLPNLVEDAPIFALKINTSHSFLQIIKERLSVLFRHHGARLTTEASDSPTLHLVRWHSPSKDPGLAILHLGATYVDFYGQLPQTPDPALQRDLLSPNLEKRLEAALKVQRLWADQRAIIPFATLSSWYEVHPNLMNIRISNEGVPLVHDAFWSSQP